MTWFVQNQFNSLASLIPEKTGELVRIEELLGSALMTKSGATRRPIELREGIDSVLGLVGGEDVPLIVTSYRGYQVP
jgi:hypothetical protein